MNLEEFKTRYRAMMEAQGATFSGNVMKTTENGRLRMVYVDWAKKYEEVHQEINSAHSDVFEAPVGIVKGSPNQFANGDWRYVTHGHGNGPQPCIDDYRSEIGRNNWPDYHIEKDETGRVIREGPRPFKSDADRLEYEKITGLVAGSPNDFMSEPHPYEAEFKKHPRLREVFPEFANWGKPGDHSYKGSDADRRIPMAVENQEV